MEPFHRSLGSRAPGQRPGEPPHRAHRCARLGRRRGARERHTGLHHVAYEYAGLAALNATYLRLGGRRDRARVLLDDGVTLSYYDADPDGHHVELQIDAFGDWAWSKAWMKNSRELRADPIGQLGRPAAVAADHAAGLRFEDIDAEDIDAKAMRAGYAPRQGRRALQSVA
jgi:catechol 2,3-dioxygenase